MLLPASNRRPRRPGCRPQLLRLEDRLSPSVVDLAPSADNTLYENAAGSLSNGAGAHFYVGNTLQNAAINTRRGLIKFNLASIPAGSTINSVTLTLHVSKTSSGASNVVAHRALKDWGEGTSNALGGPTGSGEGDGTQATAGDATWTFNFFNTQSWASAGGDFDPNASATTSVNGIFNWQWTGAGMVADVQQWVNNPSSNFGWILTGNEAAQNSAKQFDSRENATAANRPNLNVNFTLPAPSAPSFTDGPPPTAAQVNTPYAFTYTASGFPAPTFTVTGNALPTGLTLDPNTGAISGLPTTVGTFNGTVTASNSAGTATQNFSVTVSPAPTTTRVAIANVTYSGSPVTATATVTGPDAQARASLDGISPKVSYFLGGTLLAGAPSAAGNYTVVAAFPGSANFNASTSAAVAFTIAPAPLTIIADNQTMTQGGRVPPLTVQFSGFVNGETAANLSAQPTVTTTAGPGSGPGRYPIVAGGALGANYLITFVPGSLTVKPLLTIAAPAALKARQLVASLRGVTLKDLPTKGTITVRISASAGKLSLVLKGLKVMGNGSGRLTFSGSQATVNRALALASLKFTRVNSKARITLTAAFGGVTRTKTIPVA